MKHKIFYLIMLISLVSITNKVSAQFVPYQSGHFKRLAADTLYNLTGCNAPTTTPNSYRRVVWYYDSCNQRNYYWQPENQVWAIFTGGGSGGGSVTGINGLSNANDSTIKWGGNPLIENTHIRGDNFSLTIDSLNSFIVSSYPANRAFFGFDTANVIITGKGINAPSASLQLLPNNPLTYGGSSLGTARLIGTTGADAQILEVNGSAISFGRSGSAQAARVMLKYSDSLQVDSITKIAVWDSDTLKSADASDIIASGIDSIFITNTDSIFIISGNDTIFVGVIDNIRDTAALIQGIGIFINNFEGEYQPNKPDVLIAVDTSIIATKQDIYIITNADTAVFIVDSIANAPTGSEPPNTKYLVGTSPTGVFAGHANDVAELIGAVWTFTDPVAQQQLIVDNAITYASYQYDGAVWNQTSVLWRVNGNTALGQTAFLGKISKERMPFRSWNKEFMYGDTTRDVYLPKLINTPSFNYLRIDSLTGRIDTAMFRPLIEGTGIDITHGPVGDIISSTGGGSGSTETWGDISSGSWVNIMDYGGINDSTGGNYAAITAAIADLPALGGVIYFPSGIYRCDTSIVVNKGVTFMGAGTGIYMQDESYNMRAPSKIVTSNGDIRLFNVTAKNVSFEKIEISNVDTPATSTGAGIYINNNAGFKVDKCFIGLFYNNIQVNSAHHWAITNSTICGAVNYGIRIKDSAIADAGDAIIEGCWFYIPVGSRRSVAHIYQESGGGLKISNSKFNNNPQYGYYANFTSPTIGLLINGCSFENYTAGAVYINPNGGINFPGSISIVGNQFASWQAGAIKDIEILGNTQAVTITGNGFRGNSSATAVTITSSTNPQISNTYHNYVTPVSLTSSSNTVVDYSPITAANSVLASGATANRGNIQAIASSTSGKFLKSNGVGTLPSFEDLPAGGLSFPAGEIVRGTGSGVYTDPLFYIDTAKHYLAINGTAPGGLIDAYPTYIGTVSVTSGSAVVTGTGTRFQDALKVLDGVLINGEAKTVSSIASQTSFTASGNYASSISGVTYTNTTIGTANPVFRLLPNGNINVAGTKFMHYGIAANAGNFGIGPAALSSVTSGFFNTASGLAALTLTTTGRNNAALGHQAGYNNTTGWYNTAIGSQALVSNSTSFSNTAIGFNALNTTTAAENIGLGYRAGTSNTTGANNIFIGSQAGEFIADGVTASQTASGSIYIGRLTKASAAATDTNEVVIGNGLIGKGNNTIHMGGALYLDGGFSAAYIAKATSYTLTIAEYVVEVTATGQTMTLPTAVGAAGKVYTIKLTASGSSTVATTSSQTIDGSTTYSLSAQYKYVTVQSNGANWNIIANN